MTSGIRLEPEAQAFAEAAAKPPLLFTLGPERGRIALDEAQSGTVSKPPVDIEDLTIAGGPSALVALRILRPQNAQTPLPVIVYIHGAGWVFGSTQTHDRLMRELAVGARAAVVFPDYSLSPESKYPTAIEECYAVVKWAAEYGREHGMDPQRLAVAGDSVAVIEMPILAGVEFNFAIVVQSGREAAIGMDRVYNGKVTIGDAE